MGDTLDNLIFMSDRTYILNFAGDKTEWPVYMTIGNESSNIHQMLWTHSVIMVTLLPFPIKNRNISQKWLDEQQQTNREVQNAVLQRVPQPFTLEQYPSAKSRNYNLPCADCNFRHYTPVLAAWLAYCLQYSDLQHLEWYVCCWCECSETKLGDYMPPGKQHLRRDHNIYRTLPNTTTKAANAKLLLLHVQHGFNASRHISNTVSNLPKPDLLHTIQIGMLDHHQK